jgi:hypothetical protein
VAEDDALVADGLDSSLRRRLGKLSNLEGGASPHGSRG